jgi:hypothetical protein
MLRPWLWQSAVIGRFGCLLDFPVDLLEQSFCLCRMAAEVKLIGLLVWVRRS